MSENKDNLKKTAYTDFHIEAGAKMVPFAGYYMPVQYGGIIKEHNAVRNGVGLFDLSHMGEFAVAGPNALKFLQMMTTNDVAALDTWQIQYSCMTFEDGGIVDDLLVYNLDDHYMLVVNAANIDKDFKWLSDHLIDGVELINRSDDFSLLAIQGPDAKKLMEELTDFDLDGLTYYNAAEEEIAGKVTLFSRTGYTGEDGFELYIPPEDGPEIWQAIMTAGKKYNLELIGLGARDSLRLEMKMALYGNDIDQTTNPIESGLGWIVKPAKGPFIGSDAVVKIKEEKPKRKLVCLVLKDKCFPRKGYTIMEGDEVVGEITSGTVSPSLGIPIAMGYVPKRLAKSGNTVEIDIRGKRFTAEVIKPPFYKKSK
ncbi:MAG: glycine cleavage system aminomethyltransferase GcvT [candidate division Zixibacteria bacterium]|nr:glycine cleavage system aminomethyltransferase GcvT [candidate division Zixibacteria bacterium]